MNRRFNCYVAALLLLLAWNARAEERQVLHGHIPAAAAQEQAVGLLPGSQQLNLAIGLPLRNKEALTNFLQQIYDPASPNYHKFLKPDQFAGQFGPTEKDYQALIAFAHAHGLKVNGKHANRVILDVTGPVTNIQEAFQTTIKVYKHPTENRNFYAPSVEPSVPAGIPALDISGLDNYSTPHPKYVIKPAGAKATPKAGSGPAGNYMGKDFRAAYVPGVSLTGAGQTVGLFQMDGYYTNDITAYETQAGLPNVPLQNIYLDGYNGTPSGNGGEVEVSLDIEMTMSMAPGISKIILYEAGPFGIPNDVLNRMATDDAANQLSSSWGWKGGPQSSTDQIFQQMAAQGQTFFNATGDDDAFGPGQVDDPTTFNAPSDSPYIIQVGGTTLTTAGPVGPWVSEQVWQWGFGSGSSGGVSSFYGLPVWQQGIDMTANLGSTTFRNVPDVALTADNVYVIADNGIQYEDIGGTSCAAPLWAGFTALVNEQGASVGQAPQGFLNPSIYTIGKGPNYTSDFHDITVGNDTNTISPNKYFAVPGYDLCTGWGTPNGANLINAFVPLVAAPVLAVVTNSISGGNGNGRIDYDECNDLNIIITNEGTATATTIQGFLSTVTPGVVVAQQVVSFPDMFPHTFAVSRTPFTISTSPEFICGTPVVLTLVLKSDQVTQTNTLIIPSGLLGSPVEFQNNSAVFVPPGDFNGITSPVLVTNISAVGKVTVSLFIESLYDAGLSIQLIGPDGTDITLSGNNGALGANFGVSCSPETDRTTFDDAAPQPISQGAAPFVGTFAPDGLLSTFDLKSGTNVNGIWQLKIVDEFPGDNTLLNCWSLNISPEVCQDGGGECPGADLSLTMTASPNPVLVTSNLTYTMVVSNAGPSTARNVILTQTLPTGSGVIFLGATNSQGSTSTAGSLVNCNLGTIPIGGTATVSVVVEPTIPGSLTSTATVGSPDVDPNPNNNNASVTVIATQPAADVAVTMLGAPNPVPQGGALTYTIIVTNNGPFTAIGTVVTNFLPPNVNFVSATTSQGFFASGQGTILAELGNVPVGTNVVITIVVSPTLTGVITARAQVAIDPSETDPVGNNNVATAVNTVIPAADVAVSMVAVPSTVISGSNFVYLVTVTNRGPATATGIVMNQALPGAVTFISASSSQGTVAYVNGSVLCNIPSLAAGSSVLISNVVKAPTLPAGQTSVVVQSAATVNGQPADPNTNNNTFVLRTVVSVPIVTIIPAGAVLTSESFQPPDGAVDAGETVGVQFFIQNTGNIPTTNLVATLQASGGVASPSGPQTYGVLPPGAPPVSQMFTFTATGTNGGTVTATLQLQDGALNLGTVSYVFVLPVVTTFWNTNLISIPNTTAIPVPASGPAGPYPSVLTVSGITSYVSKITVTISNLSHTFPHDIGMLLVGPLGQQSILMSDAADVSSVFDTTLSFDQSAPTPVPAQGSLAAAAYQPAEYDANDSYPAGAPSGPYVANLGVFTGTDVNGAWSLYVNDKDDGDYGQIANGWAITVVNVTPVNQICDLAVAVSSSASLVMAGNTVTYTLGVTNNGPNIANGVLLTNVLPAGLSFASASTSQGIVSISGQTVIFNIGSLGVTSNLTMTVVANALATGMLTNSVTNLVSVGANAIDPALANNFASVVTTVIAPITDLAAALSVVPSVVVGSNLVYTLTVTNLGTNTALNVTDTFGLSNGLSFVSASLLQGSYLLTNGTVQCNFGNIPAGNIATATITVKAQTVGTMTNVSTVSAASNDPNPANNSASAVVMVTYPEPIIVAAGAKLLSQGPSANGGLNFNETVTVAFTLANTGVAPTTNLMATLQGNSSLTPGTGTVSYGQIVPSGSGVESFTFTSKAAPGGIVTATFTLTDGSYTLAPVSFIFTNSYTATFSNSNSNYITIPDSGPGMPYPSSINVSGTGLVSKVTATLQGLTHSFPRDVNILLVNPSGQQLELMGHCGGPYGVVNLSLKFDDAAATQLPVAQMVSGTFQPTQIAPMDIFPGVAGPPSGTTLGVFNGTNPNGLWSLYVLDDSPGNSGKITNWFLTITTVDPVNPESRLAVSITHSPEPVLNGNYLMYQVTVTNLGPSTANDVVVTDLLPASASLASVSVPQGSANTNTAGVVTWNVGTMNANTALTATIRVITTASGSIANNVNVVSDSTNPDSLNASVSDTATVVTVASAVLGASDTSGFLLTVSGQPGQLYAVEVSTNLMSWTSVSTNMASGLGTFTISDHATNSRKFYRVQHLPQ